MDFKENTNKLILQIEKNLKELKKINTDKPDKDILESINEHCNNINNNSKKIMSNIKSLIKTNNKKEEKLNRNRTCPDSKNASSISPELAEFINAKEGENFSTSVILGKVYSELKNRGLVYKKDERVLRVDREVSELFNIPMSVNKSTNPNDSSGLNFGTLPNYIRNAL